jgi:hypothetical protein
MAKVTTIILNNLGADNIGAATDADAAAYREWMTSELTRQYPGAYVEAREKEAPQALDVNVEFDFDDDDDYREAEQLRRQVCDFCTDRPFKSR